MNLKNLLVFYVVIGLPLALIVLGVKYHYLTSGIFVQLLFVYIFIYHPLISGLRLIVCNKIPGNKFWNNFIPFWNMKYFEFLFFNKGSKSI